MVGDICLEHGDNCHKFRGLIEWTTKAYDNQRVRLRKILARIVYHDVGCFVRIAIGCRCILAEL